MRLMTPAEAAKRLRVSPITLRKWADAGLIQALVTVGGHRRYPANEVERMLERQKIHRSRELKVMIVDDSRTIRQQVNFTLSKSGFEVVEAEDGADGLAKLRANPDVAMVISDVNMPNMDGLQMVEAIKADATLNKVPVLMLTTEGAGELINRARAAGAKGWIVKPFKPDQLIAAVSKLAG